MLQKTALLKGVFIVCAAAVVLTEVRAAVPYEPERVTSIAAVSNPRNDIELPFRSGLFVATIDERGGRITYYRDQSETYKPGELMEAEVSFPIDQPTAIAELDGNLVAWDRAYGVLVLIDLRSGKQFQLTEQQSHINPAQIAISPDGLVFLLDPDAGRVYWTTLSGGELRPLEFKARSTSIAFVSWNKLAVLDRAEQSVEVLSLFLDGEEIVIRDRASLPLQEIRRSDIGDIRTMTAQDGALYLADRNRIFSYVESHGELVLAVDYNENLQDITQLQVSSDSFYVIDSGDFRKIDRTIPVEVVLNSTPYVAQLALLDLYSYLYANNVLPFRQVVAARRYPSLEAMLIEEKVFILPRADLMRVSRGTALWPFQRSKREVQANVLAGYDRYVDIHCPRNPDSCGQPDRTAVMDAPVSIGSKIEIPNLVRHDQLGIKDVDLDGRTVSEHLDAMIVSPELRKTVDMRLLSRLNKSVGAKGEQSFLDQKRGMVTLPYETWTLTTAVPAPDYYSEYSSLQALRQYEGVEVYSQQVYTKQSAFSHHLPVPPGVTPTPNCIQLNAEHENWFRLIHFPDDYHHFTDSAVRVSVVEQSVIREHQIFELDQASPTWHEFDPAVFDLVPVPSSASLSGGVQAVDDISVYSKSLHHGTHIAGILSGRRGHCWSGLLPKSQLMLINASGIAPIREGLFNAKSAFVTAVNVSQKLADSEQYQDLLTEVYKSHLFVLAAGNSGVDLNSHDDDSAVKWGNAANIVVVTALNDSNQVLAGMNAGKRFVDLAAPGQDIFSSTGNRMFGAASGTSQAAPAVTAAAAYLMDEDAGWGRTPGAVKARLIATADWFDTLDGDVWGGALNLGDAVRFPDKDLIRTVTGGNDSIFSIENARNVLLSIENFPASLYVRESGPAVYDKRGIRAQWILSLKRNADDGSYRIVFRDPVSRKLLIILRADVSGSFECESAEEWSVATSTWKTSNLCGQPIDVKTIKHYYGALNYIVEW